MKKTASAIWQGGLKDGKGVISTESGALKQNPYGFNTRFEGSPGTNPEELIGAAHAGCFSMQLSGVLGSEGMTAEEIATTAAVSGAMDGGGFTITNVHLTVRARIPGADPAAFLAAAEKAKAICPVSKLLNAEITMDAKLDG
jgi:osmotically inducible protein OsmC